MPVIIKKETDYEYNDLLIISNTHEQLSSIYDILTNDEYFDLDPDRLIFHIDELLYNSSNALLQEVRNKKNFILKKKPSEHGYLLRPWRKIWKRFRQT